MDAGEIPYVLLEGRRMPVTKEIMKELGLKQGQTISRVIAMEISSMIDLSIQLVLSHINRKICEAEQDFKKNGLI